MRLECTIGVMLESAVRSGVPSLLGRRGGAGLVRGLGAICRSGDAMFIISFAGTEEGFDGEASISLSSERVFLWNFCDDLRGGGLGGIGDRRFFFFFSLPSLLLPSPFTVELELELVILSLKLGRPCVCSACSIDPALLLVTTGGRLSAGLACLSLGVVALPMKVVIPGETEDIDVGVVSLL